MGFFTKSTSKQTAKLKSLVKIALARLAVVRRPRLGRRSIARGDVAQLLSIGHLDRALVRAEQVIEEDSMLEALDILELYCRILIDHAAQLEKPKECSDEIKAAAAGLIFASARCGELPELLDARAILADKFGREFAAAAKDGSHVVVDPTLVRKLTGERASLEQQRRLAKEIAAENDILLDLPEEPREVRQVQRKQSVQATSVPAEKHVEQIQVKTEPRVVQERRRPADASVNRPSLAQLSAEEKALRESNKYRDVRMAAEAAFESASFAAMAARAAVELSRTESQGKKGPRGGGGGGGHDKVHPLQNSGATEQETLRPLGKPQKAPSPSPSPSWSDNSTVSSVWSDQPQKGKSVVFDQRDGEDDDVVEDLIRPPQLRRPPYRTASASTVDIGGGHTNGSRRAAMSGEVGAFQDDVPNGSGQAHRRHASELGGGNARREAPGQRAPLRAPPPPPYRRNPAATAESDGRATRHEEGLDGGRPRGGPYESSAYVARAPYGRIASALEGSNEHIARHEEVRRIGTDARVLQEKVYGGSGGAPGRAPMTPERRAISVRTRR